MTGLADKPVPALSEAAPMDLQSWESELDKIARNSESAGSVDFLVDGETFFTRFIDTVTSAEHSVHLQTYIFDNDDFAVRIAELLKRRSNEGVDVKILFDGLGTIGGTMSDSESLPEHHEPPASVHWFLEEDSQIAVRQKANPWFTGDHIKSTIIDQKTAYVGGMNIGREYRYELLASWHGSFGPHGCILVRWVISVTLSQRPHRLLKPPQTRDPPCGCCSLDPATTRSTMRSFKRYSGHRVIFIFKMPTSPTIDCCVSWSWRAVGASTYALLSRWKPTTAPSPAVTYWPLT
jgi:hypothetical protein